MKDINNDVPIEEVNKVIEESDNEDLDDTPEGYVDLSEEAAKRELDTMIVPGNEDEDNEVEESVKQNKIQDQQPLNKPIPMNLLQFQCSECNFKSYIYYDDEIVSPMAEKIKCLNCGKKKSVKKRILNITLNSFTEYKIKDEEPYIDPELEEDEE